MLSDVDKWNELTERCATINREVQAMRAFAKEHGFVLVDVGGQDDFWLKVYGRGTQYGWRGSADQEVWQDSTSCSESGTSSIKAILGYGDKVITDIPGEEKPMHWDESASHWRDN